MTELNVYHVVVVIAVIFVMVAAVVGLIWVVARLATRNRRSRD